MGTPSIATNLGVGTEAFRENVGWSGTQGAAPGIVADMWIEFWWASFLAILLIGWCYGRVWLKAVTRGGIWVVIYCLMFSLSAFLVMQALEAMVYRLLLLALPGLLAWRYAGGFATAIEVPDRRLLRHVGPAALNVRSGRPVPSPGALSPRPAAGRRVTLLPHLGRALPRRSYVPVGERRWRAWLQARHSVPACGRRCRGAPGDQPAGPRCSDRGRPGRGRDSRLVASGGVGRASVVPEATMPRRDDGGQHRRRHDTAMAPGGDQASWWCGCAMPRSSQARRSSTMCVPWGSRRAASFAATTPSTTCILLEGAQSVRADSPLWRRRLGLPARFFLAASRFIAKKNLIRLLDAYAAYRQRAGADPWHLVLLGDGALRSAVESRIARPDLRRPRHAGRASDSTTSCPPGTASPAPSSTPARPSSGVWWSTKRWRPACRCSSPTAAAAPLIWSRTASTASPSILTTSRRWPG